MLNSSKKLPINRIVRHGTLEDGNVLIVGRDIGQSVIIGEKVKVTLLKCGSKLKLTIQAPKELPVSTDKKQTSPSSYKKGVKKIGHPVKIGNEVTVTVLQTENGLLRFAIDAPREISICREELYDEQLKVGEQKVVVITPY